MIFLNILTWIDKENLKKDILLNKKTVKLYDNNNELYSHHIVEKYRVADGKFKNDEYYLFRLKDGKSVMNYSPQDYYELSAHLDISFNYPIFMTVEFDGPDNFGPVPVEYDARLKQKSRDFDF